ncbi:unnamed protein product [Didymodactylos carnosus]|uniref:DALR anticodon binding domain-containing protein n=1 Tax=Didymodactylos carnosus TaxID=1234261 RepID=A0A813WN70_9BILA|nr:unnamed protein product [Didymodactylos carnosus]CAF0853122.1 unnamed protein product [Didymodactylos carnosus]CAF3536607.1 unnamed protein product [Didymodactylos carnosus]CAF3640803.1 unnamed protein product [Didymodactylos carnosus]
MKNNEKLYPPQSISYEKESHFINRALKTLYVKGSEIELSKARLLLYHICRLVLKDGLELLGIEALKRI